MRLRAVLNEMQSFISRGGANDNLKRMSFIMSAMTDELLDELSDMDNPLRMQLYMAHMGAVITWVGTGDTEALPDQLKAFAYRITGTSPPEPAPEFAQDQLELESA